MRKTYSKPEIMFESFTLNTNISAGCERVVGNPAKGTCGIPGSDPGHDNLFTATITGTEGCQIPVDDNYLYDQHCYDVPIESKNLFNS